jgi:hypothetical protein
MNEEIIIPAKKRKSVGVILCLILLFFILMGMLGFFYFKKNEERDTEGLVKNLEKIILLPKDETPIIATVSDITKLTDQLFFKNAKNGNKVVMYPSAKLAIIYDSKANLIINTGPLNFSTEQKETPVSEEKSDITKIALRNGTSVLGLTKTIETKIKKSFPKLDIFLKDQSEKTDYKETKVISLNEKSDETAIKLVKLLNLKLEQLPEGEIKPENADILIIVGKDMVK